MKTNRSEFPKSVKEALWLRADGYCEICKQAFGQRRPAYDHYPIPAALGGPGTFENGRCICVTCHRLKTKAEDTPRITKAKRTEEKRANLRSSRSWSKWKPPVIKELDPDT